jgi:hypothetical protein
MPTKSYPLKIILAWGEAISGNDKIRNWLMQNGFEELGVFCFALRNKADARKWLMDNGHPELMALINAAEGNPSALLWLKNNQFILLHTMALAVDNDEEALRDLMQHGEKEWAGLAIKMRAVKNSIEWDNNDVHKISRE